MLSTATGAAGRYGHARESRWRRHWTATAAHCARVEVEGMDPDRSLALEHLMREALDLQRRLTEVASKGVGLEGIARVLSEITDRPAAIWVACGTAPACFPVEVRPPIRPTAHTTSSWSDDAPFHHLGWLWSAAQPAGPDSLVVVRC